MKASAIPFRAALFDLDGTLLDSMNVWTRVDERFFGARGMRVPKDFGRQVAGMSYRETAQYTVENYVKGENWRDLVEEWMRMTREEYALRVPLKPGALRYLRMLRRAGVRLAIATALPDRLFMPCLKRLGIDELFDAMCSTEHTDGRGKNNGEIYLLAAERLGILPSECAVFEDVPAGIEGAQKAGMRAYAVYDPHSASEWDAMRASADGAVVSFDDMRRYHVFDDDPRCVVFSGYCEGDPNGIYDPEQNDLILCADAGWRLARRCGVKAELAIGDFDSSEKPEDMKCQVHPVMKDDSDTMLCLREGLRRGYERFVIIGGFGGRFDHTISNIQSMAWVAEQGCDISMRDANTRADVIRDGRVVIRNGKGKLSVFALTDRCEGVCIRGMLYPVENGTLTNTCPIGLSNEFTDREAVVEVKKGTLLLVRSSLE